MNPKTLHPLTKKPYIFSEAQLGDEHAFEVPSLRVFDLETLGIDRARFMDSMRPTFSVLHLDPYDAKRGKVAFLKSRFPDAHKELDGFLAEYYADKAELDDIFHIICQMNDADRSEFDRIGMIGRRKRSIARFDMKRRSLGEWNIRRIPAEHFRQDVAPGDPRSLVRIFHEMEERVVGDHDIRLLLIGAAEMVHELHPEISGLLVNLHQVFIFADLSSSGENAPEGVHQDGSDYIVSALVVERAGITGGESIVYGPDKKTELLRRTLAEGEGLFQQDRGCLWHYVTPISEDPAVPPDYGHRSIFGLDLDLAR